MDKFIEENDLNWLCLALKDECVEIFEVVTSVEVTYRVLDKRGDS